MEITSRVISGNSPRYKLGEMASTMILGANEGSVLNVSPAKASVMLDRLRLLNPFLWFGIVELFHDLGRVNVSKLVAGLLRSVFSSVLLCFLAPKAVPMALLSPWSYGSLQPSLLELTHATGILNGWRQARCPALPVAIESWEQRVQNHLAYRKRRYDVYLPSSCLYDKDAEKQTSEKIVKGVVLIPGGLVDHTAYSEIAGRLADAGILVIVISLEPTRIAARFAGADAKTLVPIMKDTTTTTGLKVDEWIIMGHSQGTAKAIRLPTEFSRLPHGPVISKLVLMAPGNTPVMTDAPQVLVLQGEKDPILNFGDRSVVAESLKNKVNSREVVLPGASHKQFGSYLKRPNPTQKKMIGDEALISPQKQLDLAGNLTVSFVSK